MTRSFLFAAALALAIPGVAFAQSAGGSGADVKANQTPTTAPKPMPPMGHMGMGHMGRSHAHAMPSADRSADDLNAKELASIQASRGGPMAPAKP